jgi:hypothetical protein
MLCSSKVGTKGGTLNLQDGLNLYKQDLKFWEFTERLERTAAEIFPLLVDDNYQPTDSDKAEAHKLLDEIETWKAGCDKEKKGDNAIQNSKSDVWDAFRRAMKADKDLDALHAIMNLKGFGGTSRTAKRATAVLRMFKPNDWGVVDWRAAAMKDHLKLYDWNVDEALAHQPRDKTPWDTFVEIGDWDAIDLNEVYRSKRGCEPSLQRTADVEMAIYSLSFKIPLWNLPEIFADFQFTGYREVEGMVEMSLRNKRYRLQVLRDDSHKTNPWTVKVYSMRSGSWKLVTDFPWVQEKEEETALRMALSFIQDGKAA